jgi:hypothetical protein
VCDEKEDKDFVVVAVEEVVAVLADVAVEEVLAAVVEEEEVVLAAVVEEEEVVLVAVEEVLAVAAVVVEQAVAVVEVLAAVVEEDNDVVVVEEDEEVADEVTNDKDQDVTMMVSQALFRRVSVQVNDDNCQNEQSVVKDDVAAQMAVAHEDVARVVQRDWAIVSPHS